MSESTLVGRLATRCLLLRRAYRYQRAAYRLMECAREHAFDSSHIPLLLDKKAKSYTDQAAAYIKRANSL